jgi:hypothetical protein
MSRLTKILQQSAANRDYGDKSGTTGKAVGMDRVPRVPIPRLNTSEAQGGTRISRVEQLRMGLYD